MLNASPNVLSVHFALPTQQNLAVALFDDESVLYFAWQNPTNVSADEVEPLNILMSMESMEHGCQIPTVALKMVVIFDIRCFSLCLILPMYRESEIPYDI